MARIGLISDTHGLLRPEATSLLRGCDHIIHGGDIGKSGILDELAALAPLTAVRGNNDHGTWAERLAETQIVKIGKVLIYVIHDLAQLAIDPRTAGVLAVVSGHSHAPGITRRNDVLYINPGSAGPRRFKLPVALAELVVEGSSLSARIIRIDGAGAGGAGG